MNILIGIAFAFIVSAILIIFKIDGNAIEEVVLNVDKKTPSLKEMASEKKDSKAVIFIRNIIFALKTMGQINSFYYILLISGLLITVGIFFGISLGNPLLTVALSIMLASVPFLFVRLQYVEYKELLLDEMEASLSVITSSIERTDNILSSIKENLDDIKLPLKDIFIKFIYSVERNISISDAITAMKSQIENAVFIEWCDALKNVDRDRNLKSELRPIVDRITTIKIAQGEAKNILNDYITDFKGVTLMSAIFMVLNYLIIPWLFSSAFNIVISAELRQVLFAVDILYWFYCAIRVFKLTKDIDFDKA